MELFVLLILVMVVAFLFGWVEFREVISGLVWMLVLLLVFHVVSTIWDHVDASTNRKEGCGFSATEAGVVTNTLCEDGKPVEVVTFYPVPVPETVTVDTNAPRWG